MRATICPHLFDHVVGALLENPGHIEGKCLGGLEVDHQFTEFKIMLMPQSVRAKSSKG